MDTGTADVGSMILCIDSYIYYQEHRATYIVEIIIFSPLFSSFHALYFDSFANSWVSFLVPRECCVLSVL